MRNRRKNKVFLWILILLGLTIGFAALATTLKIDGTTTITKNTWSIYWDNLTNEKGVTPEQETEIGPDENNVANSLIEFEVVFDKPGDYYEFTVDAVNAGTIDAKLYIEKKYNDQLVPDEPTVENPDPVPSYIKYEVTYGDGSPIVQGAKLAKKTNDTPTRQTFKVRIEYDKDAVTKEDINGQNGQRSLTFNIRAIANQYYDSTPDPASFATDSWATIAKAAKSPETSGYHVGDTKVIQMDIDGDNTPENYTLRIANLSTPNECKEANFSQTACGMVIEFTEIIDMHRMGQEAANNNPVNLGEEAKGGWEHSDMRAYLNNGVFSGGGQTPIDYTNTGLFTKLPQELQEVIVETKVISGGEIVDWDDTNNVPIFANNGSDYVTYDKLYLLSTHEVWTDDHTHELETNDTAYNNTRQLDYYESIGASFENYISDDTIKYYTIGGYVTSWWLRTPYDISYYYLVPNEWIPSDGAAADYGVSPAFKLY